MAGTPRAPRVTLGVGSPVPEFDLPASDGRRYRLSDCRGRAVVVAWFPKAFTPGCTRECTSLGLAARALESLDARVFAASLDDVETNRAFAQSTGLTLPILCDVGGTVARAYGVLGPLGLPDRWTYYIGADGCLLGVDRGVQSDSHGSDVAAALAHFGVPRRA